MENPVAEHQANAGDPTRTGGYEIRLRGHLDGRWSAHFGGLCLRHEPGGTTTLTGPVVDQAALHSLLRKVRDLNLSLVSVTEVGPTGTGP